MSQDKQDNIKPLTQINFKSRTVICGLFSIAVGVAAIAAPHIVTPELLQGASPVQMIQLGAIAVFFKS